MKTADDTAVITKVGSHFSKNNRGRVVIHTFKVTIGDFSTTCGYSDRWVDDPSFDHEAHMIKKAKLRYERLK